MKYLTLPILLALGLTTAASANNKPFAVGDVFFCQMVESAGWDWVDKKIIRYTLQKFKFTISDRQTLQFGQGGYFDNSKYKIEFLGGSMLSAGLEKSAIVDLNANQFNFVLTNYKKVKFITANCDRF